jgi:Tol biopolymer transport system component
MNRRIVVIGVLMVLAIIGLGLSVGRFAQPPLSTSKLSHTTLEQSESDFQISPDGKWMVYRASDVQAQAPPRQLYRVPTDGSAPATQVTFPQLTATTSVVDMTITSDSRNVIFLVRDLATQQQNLYLAGLQDGVVTQIDASLAHENLIDSLMLSRDDRLVYRANISNNEGADLFSVGIKPGVQPVQHGSRVADDVQISPDGQYLLYRSDQVTADVFELYRTSLETTETTRLSTNRATNGSVRAFQISADGQQVVYLVQPVGGAQAELVSVALGTGEATLLATNLNNASDFQISPDAKQVVYLADQDADNIAELYVVPRSGGAATQLHNALARKLAPYLFAISPGSDYVAYWARQEGSESTAIYAQQLPQDGKLVRAQQLSASLYADRDVRALLIRPDNQQVVYLTDQESLVVFELYAVALTGGVPRKLHDTLVNAGVTHVRFTSAGDRLIYRASIKSGTGKLEFYSVIPNG